MCAASLALNSPCQSFFSKFIMNNQRLLVMWKITLAVQVSRSRKGKALQSVAFMSMSTPILISLLSLFISDICNFLLNIFSIRSSYFAEVITEREVGRDVFPFMQAQNIMTSWAPAGVFAVSSHVASWLQQRRHDMTQSAFVMLFKVSLLCRDLKSECSCCVLISMWHPQVLLHCDFQKL